MNRKMTSAALIAVLIIVVFAGCEMFEGSPVRDNLNDPDNVSEYKVELSFVNTLNSIGVSWKKENVNVDVKYYIHYSMDDDYSNAKITNIFDDSTDVFVIDDEELTYGYEYNVWLEAVNAEDPEDRVFMIHGKTMPEAQGVLDDGFASNGKFSIVIPSATVQTVYDMTIGADSSILVAAGMTSPTNNQSFVKITPDGGLDQSFGMSGVWSDPQAPAPMVSGTRSNNDFISFKKSNTPIALDYYKNADGFGSTTMNFAAETAEGTDNGYILVGGANAMSPAAFSVLRFDSNLMSTTMIEYVKNNGDFGYTVNYGRVFSLDYRNGKVYASGFIEEDTTWSKNVHAVILNASDMSLVHSLSFNADWDASEGRVKQITTGPLSGTRIAADDEGNAFIAGIGILSKFRENGNVFDMDSEWPEAEPGSTGSIYLNANQSPVDIAVQQNGKIILFMNEWDDIDFATPTVMKGVIYRFNADGSTDLSFGTDGVIEINGAELIRGELKPDGKLVVLTYQNNGSVFQVK